MRWDSQRPIDFRSYQRRRRRPSIAWFVGQFVLLVLVLAMIWGVLVVSWALMG